MEKMNYQAFTLNNFKNISQLKKLSDRDLQAIEVVGHVLPFKSNNYVVEQLINWNNVPEDPIFTLNFPREGMLSKETFESVWLALQKENKKELDEIVYPKIRKSIILGKAGIFRQTFKLPFSRFHAVFSQCIRLFTKMCLLFANLRAEKEIFHPIFNVKTYFTLSRLLIQLITGRYSG